MRLPADNDEIAGEVAEQDVVLDLRVLCSTGHAEAHVPVRGSVERVPFRGSALSECCQHSAHVFSSSSSSSTNG